MVRLDAILSDDFRYEVSANGSEGCFGSGGKIMAVKIDDIS
jgi:hypothetical protein